MKAYVINLDTRPERMESFNKNRFPFPVERFPAIVSPVPGHGEYGCALSHLAVLRQATEYPFVVFEDDCVLLEDWQVVKMALKQIPNNWDALWLGANIHKRLQRVSQNLFRLKRAWCLHAVIYNSKEMVNFILQNYDSTIAKDIDVFYHDYIMEHFSCYITYPIVATQLSDRSDISLIQTHNAEEIVANYNKSTQ